MQMDFKLSKWEGGLLGGVGGFGMGCCMVDMSLLYVAWSCDAESG